MTSSEVSTGFDNPTHRDSANPSTAPDCVGCGWCCMTDQCNVSHDLHGYSQPCPDLFWDEALGRYICLLMRDDEKREQYRRALYQGEGCCARFNPWRDDVRNRDGER